MITQTQGQTINVKDLVNAQMIAKIEKRSEEKRKAKILAVMAKPALNKIY